MHALLPACFFYLHTKRNRQDIEQIDMLLLLLTYKKIVITRLPCAIPRHPQAMGAVSLLVTQSFLATRVTSGLGSTPRVDQT